MRQINEPVAMEDYFSPGFKQDPLVLVGSQTLKFWRGNREEQMYEGLHLLAGFNRNLAIARDINSTYFSYWESLFGKGHILSIDGLDREKYLSEIILENPRIAEKIRKHMKPHSFLMPFLITDLEEKLAKVLGIPLYGSKKIDKKFGTKSGVRVLAKKANVKMTPGFTCKTYREISKAIDSLSEQFDTVVLKHDLSTSGYGSKKINVKDKNFLRQILNGLVFGIYRDGEVVIVEGWINAQASLCAQIEITKDKKPIICAAWQQILGQNGVSYEGAGPLQLSKQQLQVFLSEVNKIAHALEKQHAFGIFGPDFIITSEDEKRVIPNSCLLVELNARIPVTALSLELIKNLKGTIGTGFSVNHLLLKKQTNIAQIINALMTKGLLLYKDSVSPKGIIPFNVNLLEWNKFDFISIADSWNEANEITNKVRLLFDAP